MAPKSKTHLKSLVILQKKAIRAITKSRFNAHTKPLFAEQKLLTLSQITFTQMCDFMYKHRNNLLPAAFSSFFPTPLIAIILEVRETIQVFFLALMTDVGKIS